MGMEIREIERLERILSSSDSHTHSYEIGRDEMKCDEIIRFGWRYQSLPREWRFLG